jgi:transposase-like protein DUF772
VEGDATLAGARLLRWLQGVLIDAGFDAFAETTCKPYYAAKMGAPSIPPGRYFRMHMVGYFEGIDSERGIEWRCADSLSLREFCVLERPSGCRIIPGCRRREAACRTRFTKRCSAGCWR